MTRLLTVMLCASISVCAFCAPSVTHAGDAWTLENAAIKVDIDAQAGRFQVLDKESGYLWRGADAAELAPEVIIPQAEVRPVIDGDLGEWQDRGVVVALTPDMTADAENVDGPADISAKLRLLWDAGGLYLALDVRDEKLVFPDADEGEWWFKDSVEFWLGGWQYAVRFGSWGANVWSADGDVADAKAVFKATEGGYALEVSMPGARLPDAISKGVGGRFPFALGINDCDGEDGRQGQLYSPTTWVHSSPATFSPAILADAEGIAPPADREAAPSLMPFLDYFGPAGSMGFQGTAKSGGREFPVTITFAVDGDRPDLLITIGADPKLSVGAFGVLHPLVLDKPNGRILGARYCNGVGVPTDLLSWQGRRWATYSTLDMPWVGLTDGDIGYMLLWELPVSCDNGSMRFEAVTVGERKVLAPGVYHHPIKKEFGAPRIVRYSFTQSGGHVSICKRYRDYAKQHGFLVTQREKMAKKPDIARLAGAPDVWGNSSLKFCRETKAAGIDRLLVNGGQPWDDMKEIEALGYLMSTYDNYEDAHEGDSGRYGDFVEETDVVIRANGSRMTAWKTKSDPPKQFMKRCSALHEKVARTWVPKELEKHPYNARFIDVTTACSLRECYSETHGLTRTEDREVKRGLAKYIGDELGLVLGGEHGRWWGVDIFNYWEGMQSGGFYSWPAGYVGRDLPETREAISEAYLDWGLGEKNRYPLWELCFHDCVVSTWYWGDSTGHLREVAPDLGYKKDAFNILYGTVPLYWANKNYSYRWNEQETRERMLESYRNTCKLHEHIAFEEMVSHEFVTEDRAVQKTVFGDGTEVWVNFGEEPWTLTREGKEYVLPQYGFYAKGPKIEQYRVVKEWKKEEYRGLDQKAERIGGIGASYQKAVTCIRTDDYLFVQGDVPGLVESFLGMAATVRREGPARLRVNCPAAKWLRINWRALCPEAGEGDWRIVELDREGDPIRMGEPVKTKDDMLLLPLGLPMPPMLLLGPTALADRTELTVKAVTDKTPEKPKQGDTVSCVAQVSNVGGKDAQDVTVAAYLDKVLPGNRLSAKSVSIPAGETVSVPFSFPTERYDGLLHLWFKVDDADVVEEMCERDNVVEAAWWVRPNWDLWDSHVDVTVNIGDVSRDLPVAEMPFDADAERAKLGKTGKADPASIRVVRLDEDDPRRALCPTQYVNGDPEQRKLVWRLSASFEAGETVPCRIYMDGAEHARHHARAGGPYWHADTQTFSGVRYVVEFKEGYIRGLRIPYPFMDVLSHLGVSSSDTGWVDEVGEVESFEVVQDGWVFTQIRVKKKLRGDHYYDKLYTFYPYTGFTVTTLSEERFGIPSRAYYVAKCQFRDDKGNTALIDGKGDAENVSGKNANPKWYATWSDDWGLSCVAVTPHESMTYWDGGAWAGLGFSTGRREPATVAYFIHRKGEFEAPDFAAQDYERAHNPVRVRR